MLKMRFSGFYREEVDKNWGVKEMFCTAIHGTFTKPQILLFSLIPSFTHMLFL
jgi:hypothetical protein